MLNSKSDQLSNISPSSTTLTSPTTGGLGTLSEMAVTYKKSHKNHHNHNHAQHHHHPHLKGEDDETDVIGDLMGKYGKWQFYMTILLSLFQIPNTFHIASPLYQAANKDFWCRRPPNLNSTPVELWRNVSHSQDNCHILNIDWLQVTPGEMNNPNFQDLHSNPNISGLIPCKSWEFDPNDNIGETWNSEWDLVCDKEHLKNVAEMCFLLGVATGGIVSGYLSDKFGRKRMLFISVVLQTIFGIALCFPRSFMVYHVLRVLLGLVSVSVTYAGLILAIEYVDGKWQTIAGMYNLFPLPLSYMMVSGIAYLTQDFRYLQLIIGIPGFFLCFLWFVVPESPRWLLVKGRVTEVKTIIRAAAQMNKLELPDNMDKILIPPAVDSDESKAGVCQLFKSKYLRLITFCFLCIWFSINIVYYGIILNMNTFGGNIYVTTALAGLVEIPAIAIAMYIILKVGKKWLFCATLFATGIACMCAAFAEGKPDILWLKITFVMIGKFTISASNIIMPVYTAELYPTAIRNVGVGAGNMAAGVALIATPYLSLLTKIEDYLLMLVFTAVAVFGGIVVIFLPERSQHKEKHSEVVDEERATDVPSLNKFLDNVDWNLSFHGLSVSATPSEFYKILSYGFDLFVPKKLACSVYTEPWFNRRLKNLANRKSRASKEDAEIQNKPENKVDGFQSKHTHAKVLLKQFHTEEQYNTRFGFQSRKIVEATLNRYIREYKAQHQQYFDQTANRSINVTQQRWRATKSTTLQQFDILASFMEEHVDFARGYNSTAEARESAKRLWNEIGNRLNSHGPPIRSSDGWKKVWADFKYNIKKKLQENQQSITGTGGGPSKMHTFPTVEESVIHTINLRAAVTGTPGTISLGDTVLNVPTIPQPQTKTVQHNTNIVLDDMIDSDDYTSQIIQPPSPNNIPNNRANQNKLKNKLLEEQIMHQKKFHETITSKLTGISEELIGTNQTLKRILRIKEKNYDLKKKKLLLKEREIKVIEMNLEFNKNKLATEAKERLEERKFKVENLELKRRKLELQEANDLGTLK